MQTSTPLCHLAPLGWLRGGDGAVWRWDEGVLLSRESQQGFQAPPPLEATLGCKLHLDFVGNANYAITAGMT